jgi:hypothetical protein
MNGNSWGDLGREDGGNCAKGKGEKHGGGSARQIKQGGSGDKTTGKDNSSWGPTRQKGDGNMSATGEMHSTPQGREFIDHENGRGGAMHTLSPSDIQVDDRGLSESGNDDHGGREKSGQKKAMRVSSGTSRWHGSLPTGNPSFGKQ